MFQLVVEFSLFSGAISPTKCILFALKVNFPSKSCEAVVRGGSFFCFHTITAVEFILYGLNDL